MSHVAQINEFVCATQPVHLPMVKMCCSVCCSVLQCDTECCSIVQSVAANIHGAGYSGFYSPTDFPLRNF